MSDMAHAERADPTKVQHTSRPMRRAIAIGSTVMVLIGLTLLYLLTQATNNRELYESSYQTLFMVNVVVASLLVGAITWVSYRLVTRLRQGRFGSKLLLKLATIFALVGVAPGLLIYVVSYQFVSRSIETWFDVKVEGALAKTGVVDDLALFQATTTDELVVAASQGGRTVFANGGLTRRRGAELSLALELAPAWSLAASATWLDARYRRDVPACAAPPCADGLRIEAGRRLPGIATRTAWAELRWQAGERTDLWLEARASSRFYADDANTAAAPGHALLGLGAEQRFGNGRWNAWARIDNLADRQVIGSVIVNEGNGRYYEPAPGRTFMVGLLWEGL